MKFEIATDSERETLTRLRATIWKGSLTSEQFFHRNQALYRHSFAKKKIQTLVLRAEKRILSSMDVLSVQVLSNTASNPESGFLIASVLTPSEWRGKGYATELLKAFLESHSDSPVVLYSDIDSKFYERFGFCLRPIVAVEERVQDTSSRDHDPITLGAFCVALRELRMRRLRELTTPAACLDPVPGFIDWHVERFRAFAAMVNKRVVESVYWKVRHADRHHTVACVPNYCLQRLEALYVDADCRGCLSVLSERARKVGLDKIYYWTEHLTHGEGKGEQPMIRIPHHSSATFLNPQYLDWW